MTPAPLNLSQPEFDLLQEERTPTWRIFTPLIVVIGVLVALVIVPALITERNAGLRQELTQVHAPLTSLLGSLERGTAAELASARGFALTGDPFFIDRFLNVHAYTEEIAAELSRLAGIAGGDVEEAAQELIRTRAWWTDANFGHTRASFREQLPEHQRHYEQVVGASQRLNEILSHQIATQQRRIQEAERLRTWVSMGLALIALLAAAAALWLALRLYRSGRHILRRAQEEAALREIAQTIADAEDLQGALQRIVVAVAQVADANGAHIDQVDRERDEIEVVAVAGEGTPPVGERAPYRGSDAEQVLTSGRSERTSSGAPAEGGRPMDAHLTTSAEASHLLVVPLLSEGEGLGALVLERKPPKPAFDAAEVQRTRLLADMAALVLQRLRLFDEIRQQGAALRVTAGELSALNDTLEDQVQERTQKVQELARALTLAEQSERREIAQVLHDDLQQLLFGLQLGLQALEMEAPSIDDDVLQERLRRFGSLVRESISATRHLTVNLSPPVLEGAGFFEALRWLATHVKERFGLVVEIHAEGDLAPPTEDMQILLFQSVRELLFNVVKHAETDHATLTLTEADDSLIVEVLDEGVGLDGTSKEAPSTLGGLGLRRARERIALFGGQLTVTARPGGGTRAVVSVPVAQLQDS